MKISEGEIECLVNSKNDEIIVGDNKGQVFGIWMAKGIIRFKMQLSDKPLLEIIIKQNIVCGRTAKGEVFAQEYNAFVQG